MRNRISPVVVIAGCTPRAAAISLAKSLTPCKPPSSGTTALPSSATAKTGGSARLSDSSGARVRMIIPAAQMAMIGVSVANNSRNVSPKLLKLMSVLEVRSIKP